MNLDGYAFLIVLIWFGSTAEIMVCALHDHNKKWGND